MLNLYIRAACPFCVKVLDFIKHYRFKNYNQIDISKNSEKIKELLEIGGKSQVPFLVDTDKNIKMYESNDIIEYIQKNYLSL